jgi:hypothetical protein
MGAAYHTCMMNHAVYASSFSTLSGFADAGFMLEPALNS